MTATTGFQFEALHDGFVATLTCSRCTKQERFVAPLRALVITGIDQSRWRLAEPATICPECHKDSRTREQRLDEQTPWIIDGDGRQRRNPNYKPRCECGGDPHPGNVCNQEHDGCWCDTYRPAREKRAKGKRA
jgi:hypothetical protein